MYYKLASLLLNEFFQLLKGFTDSAVGDTSGRPRMSGAANQHGQTINYAAFESATTTTIKKRNYVLVIKPTIQIAVTKRQNQTFKKNFDDLLTRPRHQVTTSRQ